MEHTVNLARIYYPVLTLGPGKRAGIWLAGCGRDCPGCITPELRVPESGRPVAVSEIMRYITELGPDIQGFTISGGEPFWDPAGLMALTTAIFTVSADIIVYTGYTLGQLREKNSPEIEEVLRTISVLIDGPYVQELDDGVGLRGSSNQQIHVFREMENYETLYSGRRSQQLVVDRQRVMTIGIPG